MLANRVRDFDQPSAVFRNLQNVGSRKILGAVLRGIAERLEQPRIDQRGNVMRLAVQHPACLFRRETGGQLAEQRQETVLFVFHPIDQTGRLTKANKTICQR